MSELANKGLSPPYIVCAAIRVRLSPEGPLQIIAGPRHYDSTMVATLKAIDGFNKPIEDEQGFIDQHGRFYTRIEAWHIAEMNGQVKWHDGGPRGTLYSEHLY